MGEKSKFIGETGEKTVENFLKLIGWETASKGIEFACIKNEEHKKERTHGLDFFFSYASPLVDGVLKKISISVKFTDNQYSSLPSKFKEYFFDLVTSMECFRFSEQSKNLLSSVTSPYTTSENIGLLFWLSNENSVHDEIIPKLSSVQLPNTFNYDSFYIVDNRRMEFVFTSITFAQNYSQSSELFFFYPDTGKNINPTIKRNFGNILPIEYINGSILPIRLENNQDSSTKLILSTIDSFNIEDLKRLISLSQDLTKSWPSDVIIAFPDFNVARHTQDVATAKSSFEDIKFIKNVKVVSYYSDSKSLQA
ncbi:GapS4a family protein [Chryseobacterium indologenes]|uniref:GapS4a family protein n=1 Tax=Chryseobacterium indologenes TaxID=253 RepID=UPI001623BB53|nr:hypothetical protein [Chryseobacterium indologenes]